MTSSNGLNRDQNLSEAIEDHALNSVPRDQRKSGWSLAWSTSGIVTSLLNLTLGAFVAAVAGIRLAILAGVLMAIFGVILGWLVGHISYREGLSSTVAARFYGFGIRGSAIASAVYGALLIVLLALENVLLYNGTIFAFGWEPTLANALLIYGMLTVAWILLTTFGINLVLRVSSVLVVAFIALLVFMVWKAGFDSSVPVGETLSYGPLLPGFGTTWSRFAVAVVTLSAITGGLALFDADYGRYARSTRGVGILATAGSAGLNILMVATGAIIIYGSAPIVADYLISTGQATNAENATQQARAFADSNVGAYFIILSSIAGFLLTYAAQAKVQVLNVYSGSLALANLFDAASGWRPGRIFTIILSNLIGLGLVAIGVLAALNTLLGILSILLASVIGLMIADYYILRRRNQASETSVEATNWAGVITAVVACTVSVTLQQLGIISFGFLLVLAITLVLYPSLRLSILKPGTMTKFMPVEQAIREVEMKSDQETTS